MKILLLIDSLVSGGRERRLVELIKGLKDAPDIQMKLVVFSDKIHYKEVYQFGIPVIILKRIPKRNPLVFYRLYKICREWKPDIMHSWGTMSAIWAIPSAFLLNIKLINGNVTDAPKDMRFFDERLFRARLTFPFSAIILGNSKAGLKSYHVPKSKSVCIYNGFDFNRLTNIKDKNVIRKKFNINTTHVVGMVGEFFDRRDYNTYLEAALIVLEKRDDISFVAVGGGPNLEKSKDIIPSKYSMRCIFTGRQSDVESIVNIFDIGVLSTNNRMIEEGLSNAIMEYMAFEKPVIAYSGGGTNEIVADKESGVLIPPYSPKIMAKQIIHLLDNPDEAKAMGQVGRKRIYEFFNLTKMSKAYVELYHKLLKTA